MARTYMGHRRWTPDEKKVACQRLREKGWDGTTGNLAAAWVTSIGAEFGISPERAEAQLGRQLKAAIVRGRKEGWAQEWRDAWQATATENA